MLHLYDRATMAHALTLDLDPDLRAILAQRIAALTTEFGDLTDQTEFLIIEAAETEDDIARCVGLSPLTDPVDGYRWPDPRFTPGWTWLVDHGRWFEMTVTFGSSFAYVLLIAKSGAADSPLVTLCRAHATVSTPGK